MLRAVINFGFNFILCAIFSVIAYNLLLVVIRFRQVKFAWNAGAFFMPCIPFIGNIYVALFTGRKVNMLGSLLWAEKRFGMPLNFWFGWKYHYMCNNAEEARIVLNHPKCYNKAQLYEDLQYLFKNALLIVTGEKWKPRRRYLRTAFKSSILKSFMPTFYQQSTSLIDQIKSLHPDENLYKFFSKFASRIFFLTSVGFDGDDLDLKVDRFGSLVESAQYEFVKLLTNPIIPAFIWMRIPPGAKLRTLLKELKTLLNEVILDRKQQRAEVSEYVDDDTDPPLVDLLLSDEYEKESIFDVFNEFTLFAAAATDTTGNTLAFCFTLLGMYPDIQRQVYEEVTLVIGDRSIDQFNIQNLKYTEAVISETLRILPTIPLFGRYCIEDIDIGNKIVPKGSNVFVSAYHIHRNEEYWKDPLKFDPSRFFPENLSKIVPGSYLPFSIGSRNCIGQGMATVVLKITVANVIRHFKIASNHKSVNEFVLKSCISMETEDNLDCTFIPRTKNEY